MKCYSMEVLDNQDFDIGSHKGLHVTKDEQLEFDFNQPTHQERVLIAIGDGGGHE